MKIFCDTSSLFKLYHKETGTEEFEQLFTSLKITTIFLSEIAKVEFTSTVWKKVRTQEISESEARTTLELFEIDLTKYTFIPTDSIIIEQARVMVSKYGRQGLRTLDSIQLSTAISLFNHAEIFITDDKLLKSLFDIEGLPTQTPSS
jgi:predicted nucleic acid-binding protein